MAKTNSPSTRPSGISRRRRSRAARRRSRPPNTRALSSRSMPPRAFTTTFASRSTACSNPGRSPRALARPEGQAPGRRDRGPPARLRRLRRHHPQGRVWRRHRHAVGPRLLGAADGTDPDKALRKGELKFTLAGEKLQGSWVLVRMRHDRERGKRNNWLLIKHRDGYEKEAGGAVLEEDHSVASGRSMEEIAAGKGRRPKPFMLGKTQGCKCRRGLALEPRRHKAMPLNASLRVQREIAAAGAQRSGDAVVRSRRSSASASAARPRARTGFMRSSSTATACSCASRTARPSCARARDSTGPTSFKPSPTARQRPARLHHRRRGRRARSQRRAGLRRAAGGAFGRALAGSDLLRLRSAVRGRRGPARPCLCTTARNG